MKAAVSNVTVGQHIGLAHSTVSRIRAGERQPSLDVMFSVENWLQWELADQAVERKNNRYDSAFEAKLIEKFGVEPDDGFAAAATSE